jgi:DNA-binding SARP family transcriptional activator/predicted ATPase
MVRGREAVGELTVTLGEVTMRFGILGQLEVDVDGTPLALGGRKQRTVLAALVNDVGRVVPREQLIDAIWGDDPPSSAVPSLQTYVSNLRRLLHSGEQPATAGGEVVVGARAGGYQLCASPESIDAIRFVSRLEDARRSSDAGRVDEAVAILDEALGLWRGPALADIVDGPFARAARAPLEQLRCRALEDRADHRLRMGHHEELIGGLEALVILHPTRERFLAQLMVALYRSGRQTEALAVFRRTRAVMVQELGLEPSRQLVGLEQAILSHSPALDLGDGPVAIPTLGASTGTSIRVRWSESLPVYRSSFVGREGELERLDLALRERRLVTLVGPPGVGKTRTAVETATRLSPRFSLGAWIVDLSAAASCESVGAALATVLAQMDAAAPPRSSGTEAVPDEVLLVVDGFEQVLPAAAAACLDVLASRQGLRILAAGTAPLGLPDELLERLMPLRISTCDVERGVVEDGPAVELFWDRVGCPPEPDDGSRAAVRRLCTEADGFPLALEIIAGYVPTFGVDGVAELVEASLMTLVNRERLVCSHHRTLRASFEHACEDLSAHERLLMGEMADEPDARRLSELLDSAAARLTRSEAAVALAGLLDRSLVEVTGDVLDRRYRLWRLVRRLVMERTRAPTGPS